MAGTSPHMDLSAAVLAGGQSSRMGTDKALLTIDGVTVLERILRLLEWVATDVFVAGERAAYREFGVPVFPDRQDGSGPLAGLETALLHARHDRVLVVGCDMPFLQTGLLDAMASTAFDGDALVPVRLIEGARRLEPLHAIYRKQCLPTVEQHLSDGRRSLQKLLGTLNVVELDEGWMRQFDPELESLSNINTPDEARIAGIGNRNREEPSG